MSTVVSDASLQQRCIETIRFLAVDGVQKANSGHPGMPMGAAAVAYTLFTRHLRYDPADPEEQKIYGPYYQWTWKRNAKTVTVNLSASQAKTYQKAIDNHRKLEEILQEMRELSLAILDKTTRGVRKRKRNE